MAYNIPFLHTENHHPLLLANRSIKWCTVLCSRPSRSVCCAVFRLFLLSLWYRCLALPSATLPMPQSVFERRRTANDGIADCGWLSNGTTPTPLHGPMCVCVAFVEGDVMKFESFTEIWFRGIERGCTCSFVGWTGNFLPFGWADLGFCRPYKEKISHTLLIGLVFAGKTFSGPI